MSAVLGAVEGRGIVRLPPLGLDARVLLLRAMQDLSNNSANLTEHGHATCEQIIDALMQTLGPDECEEREAVLFEPRRVPCQCGDGSCMLCDDNGMVPA